MSRAIELSSPNVIINQSLLGESVPYSVVFDAPKAGALMRAHGVSERAIAGTTVHLYRFSFHNTIGITFPVARRIFLSTEFFAKPRSKTDGIYEPNQMALHELGHQIDFETRKSVYYKSAAGRFALFIAVLYGALKIEELIQQRFPVQNKFGRIARFAILAGALGFGGLEAIYLHDPIEISAHEFQKRHRNNPQWANILTITPKKD